jgi:hypothetical protein
MKYVVEVGSGVMICIPSLIKIDRGCYTDTQDGDFIILLQESKLKIVMNHREGKDCS